MDFRDFNNRFVFKTILPDISVYSKEYKELDFIIINLNTIDVGTLAMYLWYDDWFISDIQMYMDNDNIHCKAYNFWVWNKNTRRLCRMSVPACDRSSLEIKNIDMHIKNGSFNYSTNTIRCIALP
jgi:hypothetical protein